MTVLGGQVETGAKRDPRIVISELTVLSTFGIKFICSYIAMIGMTTMCLT